MEEYYAARFPYKPWFQWLNHGAEPGADFTHREFAFTIANASSGAEAYLRYQSFADVEQFKRKVIGLEPKRFEIGAVYAEIPREARRLGHPAKAVSKELVFDIDLTDYDGLRTCCSGGECCMKCWQFATVAIEVLGDALKNDFGFQDVLWVFSGRRGVHAWVCDARARALTDQQRSDLVDYLFLVTSGSGPLRPLHPHLSRSLETCAKYFPSVVLRQQDPFHSQEKAMELAQRFEKVNAELGSLLKQQWQQNPNQTSAERWRDIDVVAQQVSKKSKTMLQNVKEMKQNIIFEFLYPKLDANVSRARQHLLKSPFCVHPGTGKVCVPISRTEFRSFDPTAVPTLTTLETKPSALEPYVHEFKLFTLKLNQKAPKHGRDEDW